LTALIAPGALPSLPTLSTLLPVVPVATLKELGVNPLVIALRLLSVPVAVPPTLPVPVPRLTLNPLRLSLAVLSVLALLLALKRELLESAGLVGRCRGRGRGLSNSTGGDWT